eukprot:TRINITY_DN106260_c0_g1_i1.p2 TRINITY_DN106260_c0_g1~~TRINITY_DN106260_c0_g1_i1.p2  ORF type:complete len:358 (+),score=35.90 TRINITY_DN106260_c0_g1_i1:875-1948(+)
MSFAFLTNRFRNIVSEITTQTTHVVVPEDPEITATLLKLKQDIPSLKIINENALHSLLVEVTNNPGFQLLGAKNALLRQRRAARLAEVEANRQLWIDKYVPKRLKEVVGNKSAINNLQYWLRKWQENIRDDVVFKRGCLISGPPGIGKTLVAKLICLEEGYDIIETTASDQRNKAGLDKFLAEAVSCETFQSNDNNSSLELPVLRKSKVALIMDELEAMNETINKGGMQLLAKALKTTSAPIICICETSGLHSSKMQPLLNICYHVEFRKPNKGQISNHLQKILEHEMLKIDERTLEKIIEISRNDVRQSVTSLEMYCKKLRNTTAVEADALYYFAVKKQQQSVQNDQGRRHNAFTL